LLEISVVKNGIENSAFSCASTTNSCLTDENDISANNPFRPIGTGGLGEQNDMFQNYMDYGFQSCQDRFTPDQVTRMRAALTHYRGLPGGAARVTIRMHFEVEGEKRPVAFGDCFVVYYPAEA